MKNTVAVAIGLRYRFHDFEVGTILQNEDDFYIKTTGKYPLINLATGESLHYALVEKMEFALLNMGSRLTITIVNKQRLRLRNKYKLVKRPAATT
jgi:hypothetical protein